MASGPELNERAQGELGVVLSGDEPGRDQRDGADELGGREGAAKILVSALHRDRMRPASSRSRKYKLCGDPHAKGSDRVRRLYIPPPAHVLACLAKPRVDVPLDIRARLLAIYFDQTDSLVGGPIASLVVTLAASASYGKPASPGRCARCSSTQRWAVTSAGSTSSSRKPGRVALRPATSTTIPIAARNTQGAPIYPWRNEARP